MHREGFALERDDVEAVRVADEGQASLRRDQVDNLRQALGRMAVDSTKPGASSSRPAICSDSEREWSRIWWAPRSVIYARVSVREAVPITVRSVNCRAS